MLTLKDLGVLSAVARADLLRSESSHEQHRKLGLKVNLGTILAARAAVGASHVEGCAFTKEQEAAFARAQVQLNALIPPGKELPLLHLSPRLLLLDPGQELRLSRAVNQAKERIVRELAREEETLKRRNKTVELKKHAPVSPPIADSHASMTTSCSETGHEGQQELSSRPPSKTQGPTVIDLVTAFSASLNSGTDDSGDEWVTIGSRGPRAATPPLDLEDRLVGRDSKSAKVTEPGAVLAPPETEVYTDSITPHQANDEIESAGPMVTLQKYEFDMRELRQFFEEQLTVLQMRIMILQTKLEQEREANARSAK